MDKEHAAWHLRKELSVGTIVSLVVLGVGALAGYLDTKALAQTNSSNLADLTAVPERITRLEERLSALQQQQTNLQIELARARADDARTTEETLKALQSIQLAIVRIETELDRDN